MQCPLHINNGSIDRAHDIATVTALTCCVHVKSSFGGMSVHALVQLYGNGLLRPRACMCTVATLRHRQDLVQ